MKQTLWGGAIYGGTIKINLQCRCPGMMTRFAFDEDQTIL